MWAVIPVKDLDAAKHRLSEVLGPAERRALYLAMLEDVLAALPAPPALAGLAVVTRDDEAARLVRRYGARVIAESANRGQSAAMETAARLLAAEGADGLLALPGDVPLASAEEIRRVLAAHAPAPAVTIVPSRDGRGSNCLACSPPDAIPFRFGEASFRPHLAAARARGVSPAVLHLPGLGLDIDTPADLAALLDRPPASRAQAYLADSGIARRLGAQAAEAEAPLAAGGAAP